MMCPSFAKDYTMPVKNAVRRTHTLMKRTYKHQQDTPLFSPSLEHKIQQ